MWFLQPFQPVFMYVKFMRDPRLIRTYRFQVWTTSMVCTISENGWRPSDCDVPV